MTMELAPELIRRMLWATRFDGTDSIWWRMGESDDPDRLEMYAMCGDFFAWGCADLEPIETEADVEAFEQARADLVIAENETYPRWTSYLYAARRRKKRPASFMIDPESRYYLGDAVTALFMAVEPDTKE